MKTLQALLLIGVTTLSLACGYTSHAAAPPQAGVMPAISELAPNNVNSGSAAFMLTVNGSNFSSTAKVNWNSTAQTTTFVSGGQLTVAIPASMIATPGTIAITVTNPAVAGTGPYGGGGTTAETSNTMNLTVN